MAMQPNMMPGLWKTDNLFQSELRLFQRALGDISGQRVLLWLRQRPV